MLPRETIDNYALEIISRGESTRDRCRCFIAFDYINAAPINLARTIKNICKYLHGVVIAIVKDTDWDDEKDHQSGLKQLRYTDEFIRYLGGHLRYIDMARNENLPWSIIPSFEKKVKDFLPEVDIMLLPQWEYNYTVDLRDIKSVYEKYLDSFQLIKSPSPDILRHLKASFHIVTFPLLERKNMRLHSLLGHELGHLLADKYLTQTKFDEFLLSIRAEINQIASKQVERAPKNLAPIFKELLKKETVTALTDEAYQYCKRGLEELLSDIVGAMLFGPSALFSCFDMAMQDNLDRVPSCNNRYYPPWRMRLRAILKILDHSGNKFFPMPNTALSSTKTSMINKTYNYIKEETDSNKDQEKISKNPVAELVYKKIPYYIEEGTKYFLNERGLRGHLVRKNTLYKKLPHLVARLENGIPPNAIEEGPYKRKPVSLVEIINASWFHKLTWGEVIFEGEEFQEALNMKRNRMNNLTLKAIEYSYIDEKYQIEVKDKVE